MKSFSWTLALRYLNPLRAFVSVITLLSLLGVAFGVMVLIVVLSVHAGFERNLKEMLLGFAPHLRVESAYPGQGIVNWEVMEQSLVGEGDVEGAYALVEGFVLLDVKGWNSPVAFRGINPKSETQISALREMVDDGEVALELAPLSLEELERREAEGKRGETSEGGVVISRQLADSLGLVVGDMVRLLASANLDSVIEAYRTKGETRAFEKHRERFVNFEELIRSGLKKVGDGEEMASEEVTRAYRLLQDLVPEEEGAESDIRPIEVRMIGELLAMLDHFEKQEAGMDYFPSGTGEALERKLRELEELDLEKADLEALREVRDFVLPKQLEVTGIYHDVKRAQGPELFVSLQVGQELRGFDDASIVQAIGVRTTDPYLAEESAAALRAKLGNGWSVSTWMSRHASQFALVKTEKVMMSFALSFITLLSAFSIMAVMYTMTVQKRQEIGVMKALGASPGQIVRVFLYQGLIVGIGGALLGLGLGLLAIRFRQNLVEGMRGVGVDLFPPEFHGMTELPALVIPANLVVISCVAVVLCLLAALVPALMAAFRDPARSLRNL